MIEITDKSQCCGCTACVSVCPKMCIAMKEDEEGFLYPEADASLCIGCGLCEKVCPVLHQGDARKPLAVYAAKNRDENVRMASSSGGIFSLLAERVIDDGGVVFGARFDDNWEVIHDFAETKEKLVAFRGSKYVQSCMESCFVQAKRFLDGGRKVLFTGTSCQIAGLKNYLRKDYENLLAVDVVCHGVPSPEAWRKYLKEISASQGGDNSALLCGNYAERRIQKINFRSKSTGWKQFSFALAFKGTSTKGEQNAVLISHKFTEDPYMKVFLSNISLRPSCYSCPSKAGKSQSDITIADFWGINRVMPEFDDDKGVSLVLVYSEKGMQFCKSLHWDKKVADYSDGLKSNMCIEKPVARHINRAYFFRKLRRGFNTAYTATMGTNKYRRFRRLLFRKMGI